MVYEFAIEPELFATFNDRLRGQIIQNSFGVGTPRLLACCPKQSKWKEMVFNAFKETQESVSFKCEIQLARLQAQENLLVELMQRVTENTINHPDLEWNTEKQWIDNALEVHAILKFRALVSRENLCGHEDIICRESFEAGNHIKWKVKEQVDVPSTPREMAECIGSLLKLAKKIIFVDPYFRAKRPDFFRTFRAFFEEINGSCFDIADIHIEIQCSSEKFGLSGESFQDECKRHLSDKIPSGMNVTFKRWSRNPGGEELHNRYVLTNIGGVKADPGLDERDKGAATEFILLNRDHFLRRWHQYADGNAFQLSEEPFVLIGK